MNEQQLKTTETFLVSLTHVVLLITEYIQTNQRGDCDLDYRIEEETVCLFSPFRPPVCDVGGTESVITNPGGTDFRVINMRPGSSLPFWTQKGLILSLAKSIANYVHQWNSSPKNENRVIIYIPLMSFQTKMTYFLLWSTKGIILKNDIATLFHLK